MAFKDKKQELGLDGQGMYLYGDAQWYLLGVYGLS
jgi:hypothetical protein